MDSVVRLRRQRPSQTRRNLETLDRSVELRVPNHGRKSPFRRLDLDGGCRETLLRRSPTIGPLQADTRLPDARPPAQDRNALTRTGCLAPGMGLSRLSLHWTIECPWEEGCKGSNL